MQLLKDAKQLYQTLDSSVQALVRAREQFPNISNAEIAARKRFVARTHKVMFVILLTSGYRVGNAISFCLCGVKALNKIEVVVGSEETRTKIVQDRRQVCMPHGPRAFFR